jgi:hypothetical protein
MEERKYRADVGVNAPVCNHSMKLLQIPVSLPSYLPPTSYLWVPASSYFSSVTCIQLSPPLAQNVVREFGWLGPPLSPVLLIGHGTALHTDYFVTPILSSYILSSLNMASSQQKYTDRHFILVLLACFVPVSHIIPGPLP